jgi:hypothetical protein
MNGKLNITVEERKCSNILTELLKCFHQNQIEGITCCYEYLSKKVVVDEL